MPPPPGCLVCAVIGSVICFMAGLGMTLSGALMAGSASERDAAEDFRKLERQCTIAEASVTRREDRSGNDYKCWDYWEYRFCLPGLNSTCTPIYKSKEESIKVCDRRCSKCGGRTTPFFQINERVDCWEPAPGYEPGSPYDCRNPPCYKIFDPADEVTAAVVAGSVLMSLGGVFLSIAVGIAICVCCAAKRQSNQRSYQSSIPQPGVAMVPVATRTAQVPMAMAQPMVQPVAMAVAQPVGAPPMAYPPATAVTGYPQAQPMAMPFAHQLSAYPQAAGYPQATGHPTAA